MDLGLEGKAAIVTGGGRGIGRQICLTLAKEGVKVAVNDYYEDRASAVCNEIKAAGGKALSTQADVTESHDVRRMVEDVVNAYGRVDILVNNAGVPAGTLESDGREGVMSLFADTDEDNWNRWIKLDIFGVLNCCKAVIPCMSKQKSGKIVNIISDAARIGEYGTAVYSGAKAGVVGFSKALAKELGRYCVNVNCVAPSATWGTMMGDLSGGESPKTDEARAMQKKMMVMYPLAKGLKRLGMPTDLANAVTFLSSDAAPWITGQVLSVNGGYCMVD
ncbi:MAG: SDR family NAD(P)-dependent oxidoreductase [Thermodesulfobacteriota bacterium]|nr:SDR family NAD(P)-dependent oxidoreductase [Thermodesulfobacteriota bacterium]